MNAYVLIVATTAVQILAAFSVIALPSIVPLVDHSEAIADIRVGAYISIVYAAAAVITLWAGTFVQRWGAIRVSQIALFACAISLVSAGGDSRIGAIFSAIALGIGYAPITPASSHLLAASTTGKNRRLIFSLKQTGVPAGAALAGLVLPILTTTVGWHIALQLPAILCLIVALAMEPLRKHYDPRIYVQPHRKYALKLPSLAVAAANRELRELAIVAFVLGGAQMCLTTFLVTYFHGMLGYSPTASGLMLTVANGAGVIFRLVWGFAVDRGLSSRGLLSFLAVLIAIADIFFGTKTAIEHDAVAFIVCFIAGASAIGWNGVLLAEIASIAERNTVSEATAGCMFFSFAGVMIFPVIFEWGQRLTGTYSASWMILAIFSLGLSVLLLRSTRLKHVS